MTTRSNQPLVKVIGAKSTSGVSVMVLNEEQTQEFPFELTLALKKAASSAQLLDVQADAALIAQRPFFVVYLLSTVEYLLKGRLVFRTFKRVD